MILFEYTLLERRSILNSENVDTSVNLSYIMKRKLNIQQHIIKIKCLSYEHGNCASWLKNEVLVLENIRKQKYLYASEMNHLGGEKNMLHPETPSGWYCHVAY
jgi:hypothetical protein